MAYWLLKTEPENYAYADLAKAGTDIWDGVRNRQTQTFLQAMEPGDLAFIYHTGKEKTVVGVAEIVSGPFPDPAAPDFTAVSLRAVGKLSRPVTLKEIKEAPQFADWALVRQSRLSVMPVPAEHWADVYRLAESSH
jgi:predicted RNA-binding protein with PUA-like domain